MTNMGKGRAELRDESPKKQTRKTRSSKGTSKSFLSRHKSSRDKQMVSVFFGLCFCFAFVPQKGPEKYSGSGEIFMSAGNTKPRLTTLALLPSAAPNHRTSTLSCFGKSQPKPKLLSQLCQVELELKHFFKNPHNSTICKLPRCPPYDWAP